MALKDLEALARRAAVTDRVKVFAQRSAEECECWRAGLWTCHCWTNHCLCDAAPGADSLDNRLEDTRSSDRKKNKNNNDSC